MTVAGRVSCCSGAGCGPRQTWEWDGEVWTQIEDEIGPDPRFRHAMVYDDVRKRVVLFGGHNNSPVIDYHDTWERNGAKWERVADTGPAQRSGHGMAYNGTGVILFGGAVGSQGAANDTWQWDGKHWAQRGDLRLRQWPTMARVGESCCLVAMSRQVPSSPTHGS
jgi:hypothetical protein